MSLYLASFIFYSSLGWLLELIYRSLRHRHWMNPGFLHGPFVPIYGFGALCVLFLESRLQSQNLLFRLSLYFLTLSTIEYFVGLLAEKLFQLRLWDYSKQALNIHGRVCLVFSAIWAVLAALLVQVLHPLFLLGIRQFSNDFLNSVFAFFLIYLSADLFFSTKALLSFDKNLTLLAKNFLEANDLELDDIFPALKRLPRAFPHLYHVMRQKLQAEIKTNFQEFAENIQAGTIAILKGEKAMENEYMDIVQDILDNKDFLKTRDFFHHDSSIYDHALRVSYVSYKIAKKFKLDYASAARGALLHDFFLYDWRNHDVPDLPKKQLHGLKHPQIALVNAEKHFDLNEIERDIILRHMWPLTISPPRYRESFIVTFADKFSSSVEFVREFKKSIKKAKRT